MIARLTGRLVERGPSEVVMDVGGVGYRIHMGSLSIASLPPIGEEACVRTHLHVTDSAIALFGFIDAEEEAIFKQLIGVSGIGPKIALAALSTYEPARIIEAIVAQDASFLAKVPGLGKKTASRIVLELKDLYPQSLASVSGPAGPDEEQVDMRDIEAALLSFGFTTQEVELALADAPQGLAEDELLTHALRRLGRA